MAMSRFASPLAALFARGPQMAGSIALRLRCAPAARGRAKTSIVALLAGSSFALAALAAPPARADVIDGIADDTLLIVALGGLAAVDLTLTGFTAASFVNDRRQAAGWAIAQAGFTAPQAFVLGGIAVSNAVDEGYAVAIAALVGGMWMGGLNVHGIWDLADDSVEPATLFFVSPVIAANSILTFTAIACALDDNGLPGLPWAATQVSLTMPQVTIGAYMIASNPEARAGWIGLTAWSGALLLHGAASLVLRDHEETSSNAGAGAVPAVRRPRGIAIRGVGPAMLGGSDIDGVVSQPGLVVQGIF